jgi:hypothetical protein
MSPCVPPPVLDKEHFKTDFEIILPGSYFQVFGIHSTIIDTYAPFILPLAVNI